MTLSRAQYSWLASLALHTLVFCAGGLLITREIQYGIEVGRTSTEVDLVAAAPERQPVIPQPVPVAEAPKPDDMVKPEAEIPKPQPLPVPAPRPAPVAREQGKASETVHASRGAVVMATPNYLRNPPPAYPEQARRMRQQGTVQLLVEVSEQGIALQVTLQQSSGFRLLDDAAIQAVRKWKFRPATVGGIPTTSRIEIPVRFELQ